MSYVKTNHQIHSSHGLVHMQMTFVFGKTNPKLNDIKETKGVQIDDQN
jgi:hypothetical protein